MESKTHNPEEVLKHKSKSTKSAALLGIGLLAVISIVGLDYLFVTRGQIYTDKADIEAPSITISAPQGGVIQKMLVSEGQQIEANTNVAQVADQIIKANEAGLVITAENNEGKTVNPGEPVITMIKPEDLRVVAHIDEDKGLSDIKAGQNVIFTVDAFGSKKYQGVVDQVSSTSRQSGIVFNISDKREVKQFDVKIKYDTAKYPELKNGMSAKVTIFKN